MTGLAYRAVWGYRELLRGLLVRNLKVKYQRSTLGFVWTLLNPLLTIAVLVVVFSHVIRIPVPDYWAFVLSGYFVWNFLQQMLASSTYVLAEHGPLRRSVAFPSEVLLLATAASRLVEFALEMAIAILLLAVLHHGGVPLPFLLLPVLLVIQVLLVLGLALPMAALSVFYSDVQHALPIVLMMLFYASPVFYPASMVPDALRPFYFLNPAAGLLTLYHDVLYSGQWPSLRLLSLMGVTSVAVAAGGYALFNRYKGLFAEIL